MKRAVLLTLLALFVLPACREKKTCDSTQDALSVEYLDTSGHWLTDLHVEFDDDRDPYEASDRKLSSFHTGPAVEWFGLTGLSLKENLIFDLFREDCFDNGCIIKITRYFKGDATLTDGQITVDATFEIDGDVKDESRFVWTFSNIVPMEEEAPEKSKRSQDSIFYVPVLDTLPLEFQEKIKEYNNRL